MYFSSYQYLKSKETILLFFLFLFSFLIRVPAIYIFGDTNLENEWGIIVNNLSNHGKFSQVNFGDFFVPNLQMPPLYAFYLFFFKIFNFTEAIYIKSVLFSQIIISSFSVIIFYLINKIFFSKRISILGTIIFSLFPIHIYACTQISSVILQTFLTIIFIYLFFKIVEKKNLLKIGLLSFTSGLLILLRGEFIVLFIICILYLVFFTKIKIKNILLILLLTFITISPYLIRNIIVFNEITITKSIGFNLWKGNNYNTNVEGKNYIWENTFNQDDINLKNRINSIEKNKYYELNLDKVFLEEAKKNIKNDPIRYFRLYIKKFLSFVFIDLNSTQLNYYHPLHYLPVLFLSFTSIIGIILSKKNTQKIHFLILLFFINVALISVFFILPRYKLSIIPFQIIFSNIFFEYINNKFFNNKTKIK